jgi:hypothetical protein
VGVVLNTFKSDRGWSFMTDSEWLTSNDDMAMLEAVRPHASEQGKQCVEFGMFCRSQSALHHPTGMPYG